MVKHLKELRTKQNISQQQLARILGISQQSVNKYENHKVEPDIATLIAIADHFSVSIDYLVGRHSSNVQGAAQSAELSAAEEQLLDGYRKLSDAERRCIDILIRTYISDKQSQTS